MEAEERLKKEAETSSFSMQEMERAIEATTA